MSSYLQYINSASGAIMELVNDAACTVQAAATSTYNNVTESLQVHCQTVATNLLNYKYQDRSLMDTSPEYPDTLQPVWILGEQWSAKHDLDELKDIVMSRLWFTYRRDFPSIGSSGCSSDQGWGCMLRCGQMLLGSCLQDLHLSRRWRWSSESWKEEKYRNILSKFQDKKSAPYSIHQISLMGESVENKPVGTWFGPNTVVQVLRKLVRMDPSNDIVIHVAMDNALILSEVKQAAFSPMEGSVDGEGAAATSLKWRPLLLCLSLRLGLTEINPVYINGLKTCLTLPQTQGLLGGRPNHALYILGFVEDQVIYLDPHVTQPNVEMDSWLHLKPFLVNSENDLKMECDSSEATRPENPPSEISENAGKERELTVTDESAGQRTFEISEESELVNLLELVERQDRSFHVYRPGRIDINQLDPSLTLAFFCKTEQDFDNLCIEFQEKMISVEKSPLFEMMSERPSGMYPQLQPSRDISIQPDESTGSDYERIDRKYDSEEEFEII